MSSPLQTSPPRPSSKNNVTVVPITAAATKTTKTEEEAKYSALDTRHATVTHPSEIPPSRPPAPGAPSAVSLEKTSVAAMVGDPGLSRASIMRVQHQSTQLQPQSMQQQQKQRQQDFIHLSAPLDAPSQQAARKPFLAKAWDRLMEITPGTNQHKKMHGTRWALGAYRLSSSNKRSFS